MLAHFLPLLYIIGLDGLVGLCLLQIGRALPLQDFLNQTRALFNNSSRIRAAPEGGLVLRQGGCTSALEAMCLCFINSWSQRLRLCREIAAALAACHAAGVLHRDLTSFNVMLSDMLEAQPGAQNWALSWRDTVRFTLALSRCGLLHVQQSVQRRLSPAMLSVRCHTRSMKLHRLLERETGVMQISVSFRHHVHVCTFAHLTCKLCAAPFPPDNLSLHGTLCCGDRPAGCCRMRTGRQRTCGPCRGQHG